MEHFLVTGMNGALAPYVTDFLRNNGACVTGTTRNGKPAKTWSKNVPCIACDITDFKSVKNAVKKTKPDAIIHLAAVSTLAQSWEDPLLTLKTNACGTANFMEALRQLDFGTLFIAAGSREEYGDVPEKCLPIKESTCLNPVNPYGVAKAAADQLAKQYFLKYGVRTIYTRLFNQTAPIWPERFVDSNWCKQIAEIEFGKRQPELKVGKLGNVRDFTDCRDVARAYWMLSKKGKPGESYNICSGKPVVMADMLEGLLSLSGRKSEIKIKKDTSRIFKDQIGKAWGDNSKIRGHTGWKPKIPLKKTHEELMGYWRKKYGGK